MNAEAPWASPRASSSEHGPADAAPSDSGALGSEPSRPRRRLWAFLLSLLVPGLGQIYLGRPRVAAVVVVLVVGVFTAGVHLCQFVPGWASVVGGFTLILGARLLPPVYAATVATKGRLLSSSTRRRRAVYLACGLGGMLFYWAVGEIVGASAETVTLPGVGMVPTLLPGDHVVLHFGGQEDLRRGDIVVYSMQPDRRS